MGVSLPHVGPAWTSQHSELHNNDFNDDLDNNFKDDLVFPKKDFPFPLYKEDVGNNVAFGWTHICCSVLILVPAIRKHLTKKVSLSVVKPLFLLDLVSCVQKLATQKNWQKNDPKSTRKTTNKTTKIDQKTTKQPKNAQENDQKQPKRSICGRLWSFSWSFFSRSPGWGFNLKMDLSSHNPAWRDGVAKIFL